MKIVVFGAGGVGGYFGGRLAQAGLDVTFIARGEHLRAMQRDGLRVESIGGDFSVRPVQASDDAASVGLADAVLVCVKAWQVPAAAQAMLPLIGAETAVVYLGNGIDAPRQLAETLGSGPILGGLCRISAFLAAPGLVRHVGIEPAVVIGELDNRPSQRCERLLQAFQHAGVKAEIPPDIHVAIWQKFLFIAAVSGVGALTRAPLGVIRSLPETRQLLAAALGEIEAVGRACGIALPPEAAARTLAMIDRLPGDILPSMQRDIELGRPSELDAQVGTVVSLGQDVNIPTPVNALIYAALLPQELAARGITAAG